MGKKVLLHSKHPNVTAQDIIDAVNEEEITKEIAWNNHGKEKNKAKRTI